MLIHLFLCQELLYVYYRDMKKHWTPGPFIVGNVHEGENTGKGTTNDGEQLEILLSRVLFKTPCV